MNKEELKNILKKHKNWMNGIDGGRANLGNADLRNADLGNADLGNADLRDADLRDADLGNADLKGANLRYADLGNADLKGANLRYADLRNANLKGADLKGADIDYSSWPLWCGSLDVKVDKRIAAQLAYHFCRLDCDDPAYIAARNTILDFANQFHRANECGKLTEIVKDIHNDDIDPEDKLTAIQEMLNQGAGRRVSKDDLIESLRWMVEDYV